jgi:signal transduction histidine kinase
MNDAADRESSRVLSVADYLAALQGYLGDPGEASLQRAYEIGRAALGAGTSLITIAQAHHESLQELLSQAAATGAPRSQLVNGASQFFAECIAPYEMTYGGYREANVALRHFNEVLEQEARRIARALHDEAGQLLVAVYIALQELGREIPAAQAHVPRLTQLLDQIEGQLRRIAHELAPALLSDLGLVPALRFLAEGLAQRSQLRISVEELPGPRLPRPVEGTLYRVAKEALNNVLKHAQATAVTIRFQRGTQAVSCFIRDDGVGFDATASPAPGGEHGFGLIGIRERLNMVHGHLQIKSSPGSGSELVICVPVES